MESIEIGFVLKTLNYIVLASMMFVSIYLFRKQKQTLIRLQNYVRLNHPMIWNKWQHDPMKMGKSIVALNLQQWCANGKATPHSDVQLEKLKQEFLEQQRFLSKQSLFSMGLVSIFIILSTLNT